jgi:hypothetical protein
LKITWRKYLLLLLFIPQVLSAQFFFFGRNKVQYDKFNWKVLHTDHFNIYYYDNFGDLAEIGAKYAEEAYDEYKVKFNHTIFDKIPLIFYNTHLHFEQTNTSPGFIPEGIGGFFEFMKGRVVIPHLGSLEQFRHVIRHELVHVFTISKVSNLLSDHRIPAERMPPLWFIEGLAEFWSTAWDTQSEMVMRDAVLNGIFVSLKDIDLINGSYLMYKEGQKLLDFISRIYGQDKILSILENFWRFNKFEEVLEFSIGERIPEIDTKWIYDIRQNYFPLYNHNYPHAILAKKISDYGFNFSPRILMNNGKKEIIFIGNHYGYTSVMQMEYLPDSSEYVTPFTLIEGEREEVFEAFHLLENSLDVSKDGEIVFVTKSLGKDVLHFYSLFQKKLLSTERFEELIRIKSPSFSLDGNKVVFSGTDSKGFSDLYIFNLLTKEVKRLTNDYYEDIDPIFNTSQDKIIFASDRTDGIFKQKYNLFEIDLNSNSISYLTYVNANISTPKISPNKKDILFTSDYDGTYNLWKMPYDKRATGMTQMTKFFTSVYGFSFVDENTIVTSGFENFSFQFYSLDLTKNIDSVYKYVAFKYDDIGTKWIADKIKLNSEKDRIVYQKEYTLDYAVSQFITDPIYGTEGGALLTLSDMLGDDRYIFYIYNTAEVQSEILKNFNLAVTRISMKERTNFGFGIFHLAGRRYDIRESNEYYYERVFGGHISLFYPLSTFQRIEAYLSLASSDKELIGEFLSRKALLLTNTISLVHDNAIWLATGPIDGSRFRILLGYTSDIKFSNVNYYSFALDYRKYFRLGSRTTFATRAAIFINHGKEARRFIAGGSWDLRGWPRWSIRGEKLWLASTELRFPLIDQLVINFPVFGLGFFNIRGAAYFDVGSAWDEEYSETYGSVGVGIRLNLFNAMALRYDIGKKIEKNFSQLQPKLFYQFFFGWDF